MNALEQEAEDELLLELPAELTAMLPPSGVQLLEQWAETLRREYCERFFRLLLTPAENAPRVMPAGIGINVLILAWLLRVPPMGELTQDGLTYVYRLSPLRVNEQKKALMAALHRFNPRLKSHGYKKSERPTA